MSGDSRFADALNTELRRMQEDIVKQLNRPLVYERYMTVLPPEYGPPRPEWWELEFDELLPPGSWVPGVAVEEFRREVFGLIQRVIDYYSDY